MLVAKHAMQLLAPLLSLLNHLPSCSEQVECGSLTTVGECGLLTVAGVELEGSCLGLEEAAIIILPTPKAGSLLGTLVKPLQEPFAHRYQIRTGVSVIAGMDYWTGLLDCHNFMHSK